MAHPEHQEVLDGFDRLTVRTYRAGMLLVLLAMAAMGLDGLTGGAFHRPTAVAFSVGVAVCAANLHLYDKRFRWLFVTLLIFGLCLQLTAVEVLVEAGVGFCAVTASSLAFKEWFCFRIPGLRLVPLLCAVAVIASYLGFTVVGSVCWLLACLPYSVMLVKKWSMPLSHDIGDRRYYQI